MFNLFKKKQTTQTCKKENALSKLSDEKLLQIQQKITYHLFTTQDNGLASDLHDINEEIKRRVKSF